MAALATVSDYATQVRVLLEDEVAPYRYTDAQLAAALSIAMLEIRRMRPDIFITTTTTPSFTVVDSTVVDLDEQYRLPVLYFICGFAQLRDDEATQDARAGAFLTKFNTVMKGGV